MKVSGKVVVVTGGANGIGQALCEVFHREGATKVVVADLDGNRAEAVAKSIGGAAFACDVGQEKDIRHVIDGDVMHLFSEAQQRTILAFVGTPQSIIVLARQRTV